MAKEADVIVNQTYQYNSYRGPLKAGDPSTRVYDIHRVFLHEFGHVLGLAHPDELGEMVDAIMNSVITDLDHLTDDDIAGASFLYGIRIVSDPVLNVSVGEPLAFQVATNANAKSYEATNLPPGITIDAKTGLITGTVVLSGDYLDAQVTAHGLRTTVSNLLYFYVSPDPPSPELRAAFYDKVNRL